MNAARSDAIVFYGATGDLAYKQIFPALYALAQHGRLDIPVIGVAKAGWELRGRAGGSSTPAEVMTRAPRPLVRKLALQRETRPAGFIAWLTWLFVHLFYLIGVQNRRQRTGGNLIGKRLGKVEVPAVDQRHVHRRPCKLADSLQTSEATADDNDAVARTLARTPRANRSRPSTGEAGPSRSSKALIAVSFGDTSPAIRPPRRAPARSARSARDRSRVSSRCAFHGPCGRQGRSRSTCHHVCRAWVPAGAKASHMPPAQTS
jgi:hypothetical protein